MAAFERAIWLDTEGSMSLAHRSWEISISQLDKQPLEDYCEGARKDGIPCQITIARNTERKCYRARIVGVEDVAKELTLVRPFLRTRKKVQQIEWFKEYLFRPSNNTRIQTLRAREIVGSWSSDNLVM